MCFSYIFIFFITFFSLNYNKLLNASIRSGIQSNDRRKKRMSKQTDIRKKVKFLPGIWPIRRFAISLSLNLSLAPSRVHTLFPKAHNTELMRST